MIGPIDTLLSSIRLGDRLHAGMMDIYPIFGDLPEYTPLLTLREAISRNLMEVKETSAEGRISELLVENRADIPVLILDGEELAGAKQNRVLNTTVLVPPHTKTRIPVSCTEQGRWSFVSETFCESGFKMSPSMNADKMSSVTDSLRSMGRHVSDQRRVWQRISRRVSMAGVFSPTGAMRDLFVSMDMNLEDYASCFPYIEGQRGLFVLIGGRVVGFEIIPTGSAYRELHRKLVKSYALDALLETEKRYRKPTKRTALDFIDAVRACRSEEYPSPGLGRDIRLQGDGIVGSALVEAGIPVHVSFFRREVLGGDDPNGGMRGTRTRISFRTSPAR